MKKRFIIILLVSLPLVLFFLYVYPIQKVIALIKFYKYIELQGTSVENMSSMKIYKDYKRGGYEIRVIYKDDKPDNIYWYHYDPIEIYWDYISKDRISLYISYHGSVYDSASGNNGEWNIKRGIKVKYPPLKDYR